MLGQHWQFAQAQDQQRVAGALEHKTDTVAVEDVDPRDFLQVGAVLRMTFGQQGAIGKRHVIRGDRLAIVKACFRAQVEHHPAAVLAVLHRLGNQPVAGGRLIAGRRVLAGADHQRFVQLIDAVLQEVRCGNRARTFEGIRVEGVERAKRHDPQRPAFRRCRVYPIEVGEFGRVLERAELRITVAFGNRRVRSKAQGQTY